MLTIADEVETDVEAFEESAAAARAGHDVAAHRTALDAFAGELLPDEGVRGRARRRDAGALPPAARRQRCRHAAAHGSAVAVVVTGGTLTVSKGQAFIEPRRTRGIAPSTEGPPPA